MNNNYRIFICAHKNIQFDYSKIGVNSDHYTILAQSNDVKSEYCDVIDISDDEFVREHKVGYSELCSIHYLYTHQDLVKDLDYIGICHYRRFYVDLLIPGAIINEEVVTTNKRYLWHDNYSEYADYHYIKHWNILCDIIKTFHNQYYGAFTEMMYAKDMHHCNMVVLPKHLFFEYCEFLFDVFDKFDKLIGIKNDEESIKYASTIINELSEHAYKDKYYQARIQGFLSERLTDVFIRKISESYSIYETKMMKLITPEDDRNNWEGSLLVLNVKN